MAIVRNVEALSDSADILWRMSLHVFNDGEIADACLGSQRETGLDISLLFWLCWTGMELWHEVSIRDLRQILQSIYAWRKDVVEVLRGLRIRMRTPINPVHVHRQEHLRAKLRKLEICAERIEQEMLMRFSSDFTRNSGKSCAYINMRRYINVLQCRPGEEDMEQVLKLIVVRAEDWSFMEHRGRSTAQDIA